MEEFVVISWRKIRRTVERCESRCYLPSPRRKKADLCSLCSKFDFDKIFSKRKSERVITSRLNRPPLHNIESSQCVLCKLLGEINSWEPQTLYELRSFPRLKTYASWCRSKHEPAPVMLGSLPHQNAIRDFRYAGNMDRYYRCSSYICPVTNYASAEGPSVGSRWLDSSQIDFEIPKKWISYCRTHHAKSCEKPNHRMVSFKVIDCEENIIIPAYSNCEYVALSYVWGTPGKQNSDTESDNSKSLRESLPPTVADAAAVTRQLGFRYLWVDRYCIDQKNEKKKYKQIRQMDRIYHGAVVTLVAAAGDDPDFGLPGAGTGRALRTSHLRADIDGHVLVSTFRPPPEIIQHSKWMTRAWTFQEAILSRRLLFFTNEQLYFECGGMECCEAVNYTICPNRPRGFLLSHDENSGIYDRLQSYSKRDMTYDSDALNGFLGILKSYQNQDDPMYHISGIPIPSIHLNILDPIESETFEEPSHSLALGMLWELQKPGRRRGNFPSWSWTGWAGELYHYLADSGGGNHKGIILYQALAEGWKVEISIERQDGAITSLRKLKESNELAEELSLSTCLLLSSWMIPLDIIPYSTFLSTRTHWMMGRDSTPDDFVFCLRFHIIDPTAPHKYAYIRLSILDCDIKEVSDLRNCFGILCRSKPLENFKVGSSGYPIIVVRTEGEQAVRVGSFIPRLIEVFTFERGEDVEVGYNPTSFELVPNSQEGLETTLRPEYSTLRLR